MPTTEVRSAGTAVPRRRPGCWSRLPPSPVGAVVVGCRVAFRSYAPDEACIRPGGGAMERAPEELAPRKTSPPGRSSPSLPQISIGFNYILHNCVLGLPTVRRKANETPVVPHFVAASQSRGEA